MSATRITGLVPAGVLCSTFADGLLRQTSQKPDTIRAEHHDPMQRRRGRECGAECAEALLLVEAKQGQPLLPIRVLSALSPNRIPEE